MFGKDLSFEVMFENIKVSVVDWGKKKNVIVVIGKFQAYFASMLCVVLMPLQLILRTSLIHF